MRQIPSELLRKLKEKHGDMPPPADELIEVLQQYDRTGTTRARVIKIRLTEADVRRIQFFADYLGTDMPTAASVVIFASLAGDWQTMGLLEQIDENGDWEYFRELVDDVPEYDPEKMRPLRDAADRVARSWGDA